MLLPMAQWLILAVPTRSTKNEKKPTCENFNEDGHRKEGRTHYLQDLVEWKLDARERNLEKRICCQLCGGQEMGEKCASLVMVDK